MLLKDVVFSFQTEDGLFKLTHEDYLKNDDLRKLVGRQATPPLGRRTLFLGSNVLSFSDKFLRLNHAKRNAFEDAERMYLSNPLKYFVPQEQTVIDFLNWRADEGEGSMKVLHAGVGTGKSVGGVIDWMLDIIPTEPDWPIFAFGVKRRAQKAFEQGGIAIVTYQRQNHENVLWPQVIARWCPREHIEPYLTGKKTISWRTNPHCVICSTPVYFLVSSQKDTAFVSQALDIFHWDEQHGESKFMNANDRVQRRGGRHVMTMTPHKVDGQPETGAGTFVDKIRKGELDTSLDVHFFQMSKDNILDWVVTKEDKAAAKEEYIDGPIRQGNLRKLAEGRAKYYGEFHEASGLVVDNFEPGVHLIPPFEVPTHWTWYRYHDHGRKEPNACILVAVNEDDVPFIIAEHYGKDLEIKDNAKAIIEDLSQNTISDMHGRKRESFSTRRIRYTKSDPRSLSKTLDNSELTIQQEYMKHGLYLTLGTGERPAKLVPLVTALFELDPNKKHYATGEMGAPGIYIVSTNAKTIYELTNWRWKQKRMGGATGLRMEWVPEPENDHIATCLGIMAADRPLWVPMQGQEKNLDKWPDEMVEERERDNYCQVTGI